MVARLVPVGFPVAEPGTVADRYLAARLCAHHRRLWHLGAAADRQRRAACAVARTCAPAPGGSGVTAAALAAGPGARPCRLDPRCRAAGDRGSAAGRDSA